MTTVLTMNEALIKSVKCRHGCDDPCGIYYVPDGCNCFSDPIQALCAQHLVKLPDVPCIWLVKRIVKGISVGWQEQKTERDKDG